MKPLTSRNSRGDNWESGSDQCIHSQSQDKSLPFSRQNDDWMVSGKVIGRALNLVSNNSRLSLKVQSDDAIFHPIFRSNLLLTKIECDHLSQKSKANCIRKLKLLTVLLTILLLIALKNFKNHINFANNNLHYIASISGLQ